MKKKIIMLVALVWVTSSAMAQLSVYAEGQVGVATVSSEVPASAFSVNGGMEGYSASVKGTERGVYGVSNGQYLGWSYGVYGESNCKNANFQNGVLGVAVLQYPLGKYRTYGVMGIAGNATNGWNYGVFGQLNGTVNGAGVYGTSTDGENGSCVDGRYAGYFNGNTKVNGNLMVTGSISGVWLNAVSDNAASTLSNEFEGSSVAEKLARLSTVSYYEEVAEKNNKVAAYSSDSTFSATSVANVQAFNEDRLHYGLNVEQLKDAFPELVYEQEDGTVAVNYVEMIPILVQAINRLSAEVKVLKAGGTFTDGVGENPSVVKLSSDGKVIGTKRTITK